MELEFQNVLTVQDESIIENHGRTVGAHFCNATEAMQKFIDFMSTRQYRVESYFRVVSVFRKGLMSACSKKGLSRKHAENLARVVLQVIQNPGWLLMETNASRNASENKARIKKQNLLLKTQETFADQLSPQIPAETKPSILSLCSKCKKPGFLVLCDGIFCLKRYHWECAGFDEEEYSNKPFFCQSCGKV